MKRVPSENLFPNDESRFNNSIRVRPCPMNHHHISTGAHLIERGKNSPHGSYFNTSYAEAKNHLFKAAEDTSTGYHANAPAPSEKDLYEIWITRQIRQQSLKTTKGIEIRLIAPGWWNPGPGPDFTRAEIMLDGVKRVTGDVEIHLRSSDWESHGHHTDSAYNNVILHVVLLPDRKGRLPLRQDGGTLPELALTDHLTRPLHELIGHIEKETPSPETSEPGVCSAALSSWPDGKLNSLLELAGDERILHKSRIIGKEAGAFGHPQTIYMKIMETLGYVPNGRPFKSLAQLLPESLLREQVSSIPEADAVITLKGIFFGVGNLLPQQLPLPNIDAETRRYLARLLSIWKTRGKNLNVPIMDIDEWSFKGLRPANHPRRRLSGAAHLIVRHRDKGIFHALLKYFKNSRPDDEKKVVSKELYDALTVPPEGYWSKRYDFGAKPMKHPMSLIGKGRAEIVLTNAVLPTLLAYSKHEGDEELEDGLHKLYATLPPSPPNRTLRFISARMFGGTKSFGKLRHNARRQQGLIQIYHDFCAVHQGGCGDCLFPRLLERL